MSELAERGVPDVNTLATDSKEMRKKKTKVNSDNLYQAILARRSVRRYERRPLDKDLLAQIQGIVSTVKPLIPNNHFEVLMEDVLPGEDLVAALGGFGRILSPPHYLAPYIVRGEHSLEDLGYRVEQIAVRLTSLGIGSCYVGCLKREAAVRNRFGLSDDARIVAFLIFGWPSEELGDRAFNTVVRTFVRASNKLPAARIFFEGTFDAPADPPTWLAPLIEAARNAPSAVNAQPWRFLWRDERLYLFVKRHNPRYGRGATAGYRLHDGGVCMANVALAMEALETEGHWQMLTGREDYFPEHPASLQPLAVLSI